MPKPYKGTSASFLDFDNRELLLRQPGCAGIIAAIALQWSAIEALLSALYAIIVFDDRDSMDLTEHIVLESFEATAQLGTKRKLLIKAIEARIGKGIACAFGQFFHNIQEAYDARNKVLHARWSIAREKPYHLVMRPSVLSKQEPIVYTINDLIPTLRKIEKAYVDLDRFFLSNIRPKLGQSRLTKLFQEMFEVQQTKNSS